VAVTFIAVLVCFTLAVGARIAAGRLASIAVAAAGGAFMVYFLMPPIFSFRVSRPSDLAILACYGALGLVLIRVHRNPTQNADQPGRDREDRRLREDGTAVAPAIERLLASDLGDRLSKTNIVLDLECAVMPWAPDDMVRILSAVITNAIQKCNVQRISICGGRRPGIRRLVVTAHRVWPPPLNVVIDVGKADEDCEAVASLDLPRSSRATWFDNGYSYIYQLTAEEP